MQFTEISSSTARLSLLHDGSDSKRGRASWDTQSASRYFGKAQFPKNIFWDGSVARSVDQEVAGYAAVMELVFSSWSHIPFTESHIKQLHCNLLKFSEKDARHRANYKTTPNSVVAIDTQGKQIGIIFETASPFDTPRRIAEVMEWIIAERIADRVDPLILIAI